MLTTRISSKGQVVLPKEIRDAHGWEEGEEFVVVDEKDGVTLKAINRFPQTTLDELVGCVGYTGPAKSLAEMDDGILRAVGRRNQRSLRVSRR